MQKIILLFIALVTLTNVPGQNVKIVSQFSEAETHTAKTFDFIDSSFDLTSGEKIAVLKGFSLNTGKKTIPALFNSFRKNANKLGGNAFTLDSVSNVKDTMFIVVTIYYLSETDLKHNLDLYPKNMVYIIGDIDKRQAAKHIKLNNRKIQLNPLAYISYQNKVGEEAIVSIGGFLGAKVWIVGKEGRLPEYLSVNGFGVGPGSSNMVSVSVNTGRIYPVAPNIGQFLVKVLKEQK